MGGEKTKGDAPARALYRKYRSTSFDELVGQEHVTELLKAAVKNGTFSHAYLFTGQRGTGKTSAARILAYAINDLPYDADAGHLDIIEIDAASNRRIDDIRDLREKVFIAPVSAKYKVYIIDEVHMLTGESFNALLKTIEEPPAHAVFILATTELHKVPATIISRTQRFHFRPVSTEKVVEHLKMIAEKEKININDEALRLIAEHGGGSFRDSISLLDQLGSLGGLITADTVESILGRARSADIATILQLVREQKHSELHAHLNDMLSQGISPVTLSEQLVSALLRKVDASKKTYELTEKLMAVPKAHFPQLLLMSTLLGQTTQVDDGRWTMDDDKTRRSRDREIERSREKPQLSEPPLTHDVLTSQGANEGVSLRVEDLRPESRPADTKETSERATLREEAGSEGEAEKRVKDSATGKQTGKFDWEKVLTATKKTNPALYSVLSRATVNLDGDKLHLAFQYALHRKKLEQAQYKTQLARVIQDVCGITPEIIIDNSEHIANEDDEQTKKVADLMGGGERVTV